MRCELNDICVYRNERISTNSLNSHTYVSTENMLPDKGGVTDAASLPTVSQTSKFRHGDTLVSNIRPYFKKIWFAEYDGGCSNDVLVFSAKEGVDPKYLYYILANDSFFAYSTATSKGTKMPRGDKTSIMQYQIEKVDSPTQKKIAAILSALDEKIAINRAINENLERQAQAVFMNMFAESKTTVPATIADVALNVTDGVHNTVYDDPEGKFLLLSCKNIKNGTLSIGSTERRISFDTFEKLRRRTKLSKGDVLISSVGTVGELLLLNKDPSSYEFQRSVAMVKPNPNIVSPAYLYESLVFKKAELINAAHGAVQQCLFISDIAGFPIGIPKPDELCDFDTIVTPLFDIISANETENQRLSELRDTLLPKLMSGDLDVSNLML